MTRKLWPFFTLMAPPWAPLTRMLLGESSIDGEGDGGVVERADGVDEGAWMGWLRSQLWWVL